MTVDVAHLKNIYEQVCEGKLTPNIVVNNKNTFVFQLIQNYDDMNDETFDCYDVLRQLFFKYSNIDLDVPNAYDYTPLMWAF